MSFLSDISGVLFLSFFTLCSLTPALFLLITGIIFYSVRTKTPATRILALNFIFMGIFFSGYNIAATVYHPLGAYHRWITVTSMFVCFTLWMKFFFNFPEPVHERLEKNVIIAASSAAAMIILAFFIFTLTKAKITYNFDSQCYDFSSAAMEKFLSFFILLFLFMTTAVGVYRIHITKGNGRYALIGITAFYFTGILIPSLTNILSKYGIITRGVYQISQDFSSLLTYFSAAIIYINASHDRTTVISKISTVSLAVFLLIFQIISFASLRGIEASFALIKEQESRTALFSGERPEGLAYLASYNADEDRFTNIIPTIPSFSIPEDTIRTSMKQSYEIHDAGSSGITPADTFRLYRQGKLAENYYCLFWFDSERNTVYEAGYGYTSYRAFIHPTSAVLTVILIGAIVLLLAAYRLFFLGALVHPLRALQGGIEQIRGGNFKVSLPVTAEDEIGEITRVFNRMAAQIHDYNINMQAIVNSRTSQLLQAEKMASLGNMISGMAHEINTPVGISITAITAAHDKIEDILAGMENNTLTKTGFRNQFIALSETLSITELNLNRAAALINNFKKVSSDRRNEEKRAFLVKDYLKTLITSLSHEFREKNIRVIYDIDDAFGITSYPGFLSQIVINLFLNAVTHGYENKQLGTITMKAHTEDSTFVFSMHNDGNPIPVENIPRIFDPFFTTKRNKGGTGLGLNIVYNIVTYNLNGSIVCESSEEKGTTITVRFPLDETAAADEGETIDESR